MNEAHIEEKRPAIPEQKELRKWEWKYGVAETLAEAFSEKLPETEIEALRMLYLRVRGIHRETSAACDLLREIQHDLRRITIEIC
jgi:hypothetical protein